MTVEITTTDSGRMRIEYEAEPNATEVSIIEEWGYVWNGIPLPEEMTYWDAIKIAESFKPWLEIDTIARLLEIDVETEKLLGKPGYGMVVWHALKDYQKNEITNAYNSGKWDPDNSRFEGVRF